MTTGHHEVGFRTTDPEELTDYQSFSRLAIAALILGILSATALIQPLLWVVPVVAVILSFVAMRQIALSDERPSGRVLAITGLSLAVIFGSWASTWYLSRYFLLVRQAREHSEAWLNLVREGRLYEAHQLSISYSERARPGEKLEPLYTAPRDASAQSKPADTGDVPMPPAPQLPEVFQQWRQNKPLDQIIAFGKNSQLRFDQHLKLTRIGVGHTMFEELFTAAYNKEGLPATLQFKVVVERIVSGDIAHWQVTRVEDAKSSS